MIDVLAQIVDIGNNPSIILIFAVGVFSFYLVVAILVMGVEAIKRFLDIA